MRTEAERRRIAEECVKIEQAGGDVLDFLKNEMCSYSPRGTWINLQKEVLPRAEYQITDGKPKAKGDEQLKKMEKQRMTVNGLIDCMKFKWHVKQYLLDRGYTNPKSALANAKAYAKKNMPVEYEKIKDLQLSTNENSLETPDEMARELVSRYLQDMKAREEKIRTEPEWMKKAVEAVREFAAAADDHAQKASPTCCQPAKSSGVTVPDELPKNDSLRVSAVESWHGKYELCGYREDPKFMAMAYHQGVIPNVGEILFSPENWLKFADEIPKALKRLGLKD